MLIIKSRLIFEMFAFNRAKLINEILIRLRSKVASTKEQYLIEKRIDVSLQEILGLHQPKVKP